MVFDDVSYLLNRLFIFDTLNLRHVPTIFPKIGKFQSRELIEFLVPKFDESIFGNCKCCHNL